MEFNFRGFDTQRQYNHVYPSPSSLNYTYISDPRIIRGLWSGRSVRSVDMIEEMQIVGYPSSVMQPQSQLIRHRLDPEMVMLHGEPFSPHSDIRVAMPLQERYGGRGYHHRHVEAVPFQRSTPETKEIIGYQPRDLTKEIIVLGKPTGATVSGSKRKAPAPPTVAGSSEFCSKKIEEDWRCTVCGISATCERGLMEHVAGKKHMAKVESLKNNNIGGNIGLGVTVNSVKIQKSQITSLKGNKSGGDIGLGLIESSVPKQTCEIKCVSVDSKKVKMSGEGGKMRQNFKFWCKMCQTGAHDEKVMIDHKKGKKHIKNRRMKARERRRFSNRK